MLLRRHPVRDRFFRVFIAQLVEVEPAAPGDLDRAGERVLVEAEQPRHLGRRLQVALGIGGEADPASRIVQCSRMQVTTSCNGRRSGT